MIERPIFLDETGRRWKIVRPLLVASVAGLIGIVGLLILSIEMVGTIPELPIVTSSVTPALIGQAKSKGTRSVERPAPGGVTDAAAPTQVAKATSTNPGEWLIRDVALERARLEVAQADLDQLTGRTAAANAHIQGQFGLRSVIDERGRAEEATGSVGGSGALALAYAPRKLDSVTSFLAALLEQTPEDGHLDDRVNRDTRRKHARAPRETSQRGSADAQHLKSRREIGRMGALR